MQGHEPPKSTVRGIMVRNVKGSLRALGELRGNKGNEMIGILLENIDVTVGDAKLNFDDKSAIRFHHVKVNGALLNKP